jgi:hypothetical protein
MRYRLGMKDDGWLVVDTERRRVAHFGGLRLESLSPEEAHVMLGLIEAYDRGVAAEEGFSRPHPASPAPTSPGATRA